MTCADVTKCRFRFTPPFSPNQVDVAATEMLGLCTCTRTLLLLLSAACLRVPLVLPQEILPLVIFTQGEARKKSP